MKPWTGLGQEVERDGVVVAGGAAVEGEQPVLVPWTGDGPDGVVAGDEDDPPGR
jgi:hypothetical protein